MCLFAHRVLRRLYDGTCEGMAAQVWRHTRTRTRTHVAYPAAPLSTVYHAVKLLCKGTLQVQDSTALKIAVLSRVASAVMRTLVADSDFATAVLPGEEGVCTVHRFDQVGCAQLAVPL